MNDQANGDRPALAPDPQRQGRDRRTAAALGESLEWFDAHRRELYERHPGWRDMYVAVAAGTASKVLAVGEDRERVLDQAEQSAELQNVARREGLPPGSLVVAISPEEWWPR
jgi:hypothetical protein